MTEALVGVLGRHGNGGLHATRPLTYRTLSLAGWVSFAPFPPILDTSVAGSDARVSRSGSS
jgi:hypothetical protein